VGGCDEVDIMAAHILESDHHFRQIFILNFFSLALMGDGPVLAEDTTKIAVGEEDRSRPIISNQRHFFTKMGMRAEDYGYEWSPAEPFLASLPIHSALPGTQLAIFEDVVSLFDPLGELTLFL